ncbi:MAG TPA: hypothetical protein VGK29_01900 [Paludibaculum sp.]|jgi:hypothetical protein
MSQSFERDLDPSIRRIALKSAFQAGVAQGVLIKTASYLPKLSPGDIQTMAGAPGMKGYDRRTGGEMGASCYRKG